MERSEVKVTRAQWSFALASFHFTWHAVSGSCCSLATWLRFVCFLETVPFHWTFYEYISTYVSISFSIFFISIVFLCYSFSALTLLVRWQEGHPACKKLDVALLMATIWLELCMSYSSSCHHSPPPSSLAPIKSRMDTFSSGTDLSRLSWKLAVKRAFIHCVSVLDFSPVVSVSNVHTGLLC